MPCLRQIAAARGRHPPNKNHPQYHTRIHRTQAKAQRSLKELSRRNRTPKKQKHNPPNESPQTPKTDEGQPGNQRPEPRKPENHKNSEERTMIASIFAKGISIFTALTIIAAGLILLMPSADAQAHEPPNCQRICDAGAY